MSDDLAAHVLWAVVAAVGLCATIAAVLAICAPRGVFARLGALELEQKSLLGGQRVVLGRIDTDREVIEKLVESSREVRGLLSDTRADVARIDAECSTRLRRAEFDALAAKVGQLEMGQAALANAGGFARPGR